MKVDIRIDGKMHKTDILTVEEYYNVIDSKDTNYEYCISNIVEQRFGPVNRHTCELIFIQLWLSSLNNVNVNTTYECCGKEHEVCLAISNITTSETTDLFFDLNDIKLKFNYPVLFRDEDTADIIISCLEYVIQDGIQINKSDMSDEEIIKILDILSLDDLEKIISELLGPEVILYNTGVCKCQQPVIIKGISDIMDYWEKYEY